MTKGLVSEEKPANKPKTTKRPDIQLLRAFAVIAVVGYHFELPGFTYGFLGVDIFLVVSGYLVGGSLIREIRLSGKIDFKRFFSSRIKRLLPAALAVTLFTVALLQITNQLTTREIRHAFWSLLYVQNINLGIEGSSYLGGDLNPSYFVHYWSLSLEEQFYILAPLLLLIIFRSRLGRRVLAILAVVALASFAFSLMQTLDGEASAYYSILTRAWQFIIGMLIANYLPTKSMSKKLWGLAVVLIWGFVVSITLFPDLAFPSPGALIPSLFAGVFLVAGSATPLRLPFDGLQKLGVLIGDISYSMYLIHFPLALLFLDWSNHNEGSSLIIIGLITTLFLSIVAKSFIEDPFRFEFSNSKMPGTGTLRILFANLLFAAVLIALANSLTAQAAAQQPEEKVKPGGVTEGTEPQEESSMGLAFEDCIGARSLLFDECSEYLYADPVIPPQSANESKSDAYSNGCHLSRIESASYKSCYYGETVDFTKTVALIGDSHATQWLPGLHLAGKSAGVRVKTYLMSGCSLSTSWREGCAGFSSWVHQDVNKFKEEIQAIYISTRISNEGTQDNFESIEEGFSRDLQKLTRTTNEIFLIEDTPLGSVDNSDPNLCLIAQNPMRCSSSKRTRTFPNPYKSAVETTGIGSSINVDALFCVDNRCYSSIGGLPIYRDSHHLTEIYSESSSPFWVEELAR